MEKKIFALKILIFGRVQGVFFRAWAKKHAQLLGIEGWAKNLADGSLEIFAQGEEANLEKFLFSCLKGSESSDVSKITVVPTQKRNLKNFEIF